MVKPRQLGHLVINVRDLDRAEKFYTEVMGLEVSNRSPGRMVFMIANDDLSHELALVSVGDEAPGPELSRVGLAHMAWQMDSFDDLKEMYRLLKDAGTEIRGIGDHGMSLGVYFSDPDGNEIEVYYELPKDQWSDENRTGWQGHFPMSLEEEPAGATTSS